MRALFQSIQSIEAFCDEWSMIISFLMIMMIYFLFLAIRSHRRSNKEHEKRLARRNKKYESLFESYEVYRAIAEGYLRAIRGDWTASYSSMSNLIECSGNLWKDISLKGLPTKTEVEEFTKLMWNLRSALFIIGQSRHRSQKGFKMHEQVGGKSYDVSEWVQIFHERIQYVTDNLGSLFLNTSSSGLGDSIAEAAKEAMNPIVIAGHINQARNLLEFIQLGTEHVKMEVAQEFSEQCVAAGIDPLTLAEPKDKENLDKVMQAVALISNQEEPPEEEPVTDSIEA